MVVTTIYVKRDCAACKEALAMLEELAEVVPHRLVEIPIDSDPDLYALYGEKVPVIHAGPYRLKFPFTKQDLEVVLRSAQDRVKAFKEDDTGQYQKQVARRAKATGADRFTYWLGDHYMILFNLLAFLFVGISFLAPVMMQAGLEAPAKILYTAYRPMCHQFAFRSWFLFGDQPYYPRELAGVEGVMTYEELAALIPDELITVDGKDAFEAYTFSRFPERIIPPEAPAWELSARNFIGVNNDVVNTGYKTALCERDVAMWGSFFMFGLLFAVFRKRIKPLPWYLWLLLAIFPVGLDGGSQLLGFLSDIFPGLVIIRESTPLLRTLTGSMFGVFTGWFIYPQIETTMAGTRRFMKKKFASIAQQQAELEGMEL
jgi:uncharacterized membrane protein